MAEEVKVIESKLELIVNLILSEPSKAIEVIKKNEIEDKEEYTSEFEGDREIRTTQVGMRPAKPKVEVTKIPFDYQGMIVETAMSFLFSEPVIFQSEQKESLEKIKNIWAVNRMDNVMMKFTEKVKSECEGVLFFMLKEKEGKKELKIRLYDSSHGTYAPYLDEYGDLILFQWKFSVISPEGKDIEHVWIFTKDFTYRFIKQREGYELNGAPEAQPLKKIPVVYMRQKAPEWWKVRFLIDRYENGFSKFCDTNDYFGSPTVIAKGQVGSMPGKDTQGKIIQIPKEVDSHGNDVTGSMEYLTWQHAPASTELEWKNTKRLIHDLTKTPDISFDNMKAMVFSGDATAKMQFMAALLKAKRSYGDYEETIDRIIALIKGFGQLMTNDLKLTATDEKTVVKVRFQSPMPEAIAENIDTLVVATQGRAIMSTETAVALNPLVKDVIEEKKRMDGEAEEALAATFNIETPGE